jgi:hypothetical protein
LKVLWTVLKVLAVWMILAIVVGLLLGQVLKRNGAEPPRPDQKGPPRSVP